MTVQKHNAYPTNEEFIKLADKIISEISAWLLIKPYIQNIAKRRHYLKDLSKENKRFLIYSIILGTLIFIGLISIINTEALNIFDFIPFAFSVLLLPIIFFIFNYLSIKTDFLSIQLFSYLGMTKYNAPKLFGTPFLSAKQFIESGLGNKLDVIDIADSFEGIYNTMPYYGGFLSHYRLYKHRLIMDMATENYHQYEYYCVFKLQKKFDGKTIIVPQEMKIYDWIQSKLTDMKKAGLVDPVFEKQFEVYTSNQVEARFIFDHLKIEKLTALVAQKHIEQLSVSIWDNNLALKINFTEDDNISNEGVNPLLLKKQNFETLFHIYNYLNIEQHR